MAGIAGMRFLLDTHVWLWSQITPHRLSSATQAVLADPQHELHLSPISVWEAMLLIERGRIQVDTTPAEWVALALTRSPLHEAPLTHAIAVPGTWKLAPNVKYTCDLCRN
jgi:PIN domain nuclease of toxin-antitoxin system